MKRVLVVDDERDIRLLLKETLAMEGYETDLAADGAEAVRLLENGPDLILLDICLPDMDGYQVCRDIRSRTDAPIVFLSARVEEADRIMGLKVGGDDYIMKPFSMDELLARIEAHFRREERAAGRETAGRDIAGGLCRTKDIGGRAGRGTDPDGV